MHKSKLAVQADRACIGGVDDQFQSPEVVPRGRGDGRLQQLRADPEAPVRSQQADPDAGIVTVSFDLLGMQVDCADDRPPVDRDELEIAGDDVPGDEFRRLLQPEGLGDHEIAPLARHSIDILAKAGHVAELYRPDQDCGGHRVRPGKRNPARSGGTMQARRSGPGFEQVDPTLHSSEQLSYRASGS